MRHEYLDSGVEVVLKENRFAPAVAIQVWVGVGSLSEGAAERGMAHFIEHMLFKGTDRRAVGEIAAVVEGCGGEINAYTTFDHTVFHLTLAAPHAGVGLDLLADAFAHSRFDPVEFEREREVILEEIRRGNDSPGARVGRRVFEMIFAGTEAGRPIIGSEESVRSFTRDDLYAFYKRWYQPTNATLVIVGDIEAEATLRQVRATFGALQGAPLPPRPALPQRSERSDGPEVAILRGDFQQPRIEIVFPAPALEEFDSTALDLAAFALGSGEMSRLTRSLRDEDGSVTSIGASLYSPMFGGVFELSALAPPELLLAATSGMAREIARLRSERPVTADELQRARANLRADRIFQEETVDGQARTLGFGLRTPQKLLYDDVYTALINGMPESAVAGAVQRWLRPEAATIVVLVHNDADLNEAQVRQAFKDGLAAPREVVEPRQRAAVAKAPRAERAAETVQLKPGIKLIYRYNPNVELFTLTAATEGGQRSEDGTTAGITNALAGMLATASEQYSYEALMAEVESRGASLEGFSGKDSLGFHFQCLTEQAGDLLNLWRGCLKAPVFPDEQWVTLRRELMQALESQNDSPANVCVRKFQELIFGAHPYRYPLIGTQEVLASLNPAGLLKSYLDLRDRGPWVIAVASTKTCSEVTDLVLAALDGFSPAAGPRVFPSSRLITQATGAEAHIAKDREQSHIVHGFGGLTWGDPDRPALDVLVNVLGGHGGRLFRELRDKESLAYTVSPILSYGCHPGVVGSYIACAPEKVTRALAALAAEMGRLTEVAPDAAELERARNFIVGTHDMGLQKSDAQTSTMALMELYGHGYDDFLRYPKAIGAVTAADVLRVARRVFQPKKAITVTVGP